MEPVLLRRSEIDDQLWNESIDRSQQRVVYGFSWYLDVVCEDWNALVWPSALDYQIVMPLPVRKRYGFSLIYQPHFCQYLGIFSEISLTADQVKYFLQACSLQFPYISAYSLHPKNYEAVLSEIVKVKDLNYVVHKTQIFSLQNNFQEIQKGYSADRKQNIKRSLQWNWTSQSGFEIETLIELFQSSNTSTIQGGVSLKTYRVLTELYKKLAEKRYAELNYASIDGKIHAGALFINDGQHGIYLFNAADQTGRKGNARTWLLNLFFEDNCQSIGYFDFESAQVEQIASFYKSFGGETIPFIQISKNKLPLIIRLAQNFRKWFFKTRQDLF